MIELNDMKKSELKEAIMGDIPEEYHKDYDFDKIVANAQIDEEEEMIIVTTKKGAFAYHLETLDQLFGVGM